MMRSSLPALSRFVRTATAALVLGAMLCAAPTALGIEINAYQPARHDRFSSGFPSAPVANMDPSFIGAGYDWSGVGWWSNDIPLGNGESRGYALLGERYFLYARHYPPAIGGTINFMAADGTIHGYVVGALSGALPGGTSSDLAVGMFTEPIPDDVAITPYTILFKGYSTSAYFGLDLLQYGRGNLPPTLTSPRIGRNEVDSVIQDPDGSGIYYYTFRYDKTTPDRPELFGGDSGSPSFYIEVDDQPGQPKKMYLAGAHYATAAGEYGLDSMLAMMLPEVLRYMAATGDLPRVWTPVTATWIGKNSERWGLASNWSPWSGAIANDVFTSGLLTTAASVLFDAGLAQRHDIELTTDRSVTGITFRGSAAQSPFTLFGSGKLSIGESGLRNEHALAATLNNPIALRSSQRWDVGAGGVFVGGTIDTGSSTTNRYLWLIDGAGDTTLASAVSGTGNLSKYGSGTLTFSGSLAWGQGSAMLVNEGTLRYELSAPTTIAAGNLLRVGPGATVELTGIHSALGNGSQFVDVLVDGTILVPVGADQITGDLWGSGEVIVEGKLTIYGGGTSGTLSETTSGGSSGSGLTPSFTVVPEPSTTALAAIAALLLGMLVAAKRRAF